MEKKNIKIKEINRSIFKEPIRYTDEQIKGDFLARNGIKSFSKVELRKNLLEELKSEIIFDIFASIIGTIITLLFFIILAVSETKIWSIVFTILFEGALIGTITRVVAFIREMQYRKLNKIEDKK